MTRFELYRPSQEMAHGSVLRERLLAPLQEASMRCALLMIWGAPGIGKSRLARQLCDRLSPGVPVLWYSASPRESDAVLLAQGLTEALGRIVPSLRAGIKPGETPEQMAGRIADACTEVLRRDVLVALDDLTDALASRETALFVTRLCESAPPQLHVLAITRTAAALPAESLRARDRTFELGPPDLLWTVEEVQQLLEALRGRPVPLPEAREATRWCGGWVAPLVVAVRAGVDLSATALSQPVEGQDRDAAEPPEHPAVTEWLMAHTFDQLPPQIREFVARTAPAPELTLELAAALTDRPLETMGQVLQSAVSMGVLIEPLPGARYRYHRLWAQATRSWLLRTGGRRRYREIHRRLADAYLAAGDREWAVESLMRGELWDMAADQIASLVMPFLEQRRHATLWRWIEALPEKTRRRHGGLFSLARAARLRRLGRLDEADVALATARREGSPEVRTLLEQAEIAVARGDYGRSAALASQAARALEASHEAGGRPPGETSSASSLYDLGTVLSMTAQALWYAGRRREAAPLIRDALATFRSGGFRQLEARAMVLVAITEHEAAGHLHRVLDVVRAARDLAGAEDDGTLSYYLGSALHNLGEYEQALPHYLEALERNRRAGSITSEALAIAKLGILHAECHDLPSARDRLLEARRLLDGLGEPFRMANVYWGLSVVHRFQGEPAQAADYARRDLEMMESLGFEVYVAESHINLALCTLATGDVEASERDLERCLPVLTRWQSAQNLAVWHLVKAACATARRQPESLEEADRSLSAALRLCEEHGYRFLWRREAALSALLLKTYVGRHPHDAYAAQALSVAESQPVEPQEVAVWRLVLSSRAAVPAEPPLEGAPEAAAGPAHPGGTLTVRMMGRFEMRLSGQEIPVGRWRPKAQRVLKCLLVRWNQWVESDVLVEQFWGGDATTGRRALAVAVHYLRRQLTPWGVSGLLESRPGGYRATDIRLHVPAWVDVQEMRDLVRTEGPPERVVELYRGHLLEESPYEEWVDGERSRLLLHAVQAAETLAGRAFSVQDWVHARQYAERALELDPLREGAHRLLMTVLYATGRRNEAIRQFKLCRSLLQRELGVAPDPATVRLAQQILDRQPLSPALGL